MHTLEFDQQTEQSLIQLAALSGKTPDELLREMTTSLITKKIKDLTSSSQPIASYDKETNQANNWDVFFANFCAPVVDTTPCR